VPKNLSLAKYPSLLEKLESNPTQFFKDSQKDVNKSLLLYYLNSGYGKFDQYKEYDANCASTEIDKPKIIRDIQAEKLTDKELHEKLETFFAQHSYTGANLISCGCCGIRQRERIQSPEIKYQRLYLKDPLSSILEYRDEARFELELQKQMSPVPIPINATFTMQKVHPWKIRSIYESTRLYNEAGTDNATKDIKIFHLHPELVDIDDSTGDESTLVCPSCWKAINSKTLPELSIAAGYDLGYHKRLGLEPPNLDEQMILARCRVIIATLKIKSNCLGKVGFHRDKLLCNAILFAHNAPNKAASMLNAKEMLSVSGLKDMLKLYFIDPNGNIDKLFHNAMQRNDIFARPWVICQWLTVLQ
jgi:hypothetical protein